MGTEVLKRGDDKISRSFSRKLWKHLILRKQLIFGKFKLFGNARSDIMGIIGKDSS